MRRLFRSKLTNLLSVDERDHIVKFGNSKIVKWILLFFLLRSQTRNFDIMQKYFSLAITVQYFVILQDRFRFQV